MLLFFVIIFVVIIIRLLTSLNLLPHLQNIDTYRLSIRLNEVFKKSYLPRLYHLLKIQRMKNYEILEGNQIIDLHLLREKKKPLNYIRAIDIGIRTVAFV